MPLAEQEVWVRNAVRLPLIKTVGETLLGFMPPDIAQTLSNTALMKNPDSPVTTAGQPAADPAKSESGYQPNEAQGLDNLLEGTCNATQQPTFGQSTGQ